MKIKKKHNIPIKYIYQVIQKNHQLVHDMYPLQIEVNVLVVHLLFLVQVAKTIEFVSYVLYNFYKLYYVPNQEYRFLIYHIKVILIHVHQISESIVMEQPKKIK